MKEINKVPLLSAEEEKELAVRILEGDSVARDRMIRANLRLVVSIAKEYIYHGLSLLDLIGEGNLGLLHAVKGFKPSEGCRFSTYATYWINHSILRALANTSKLIRLPAYLIEKLAKWKAKSHELSERLNRQPTLAEIAKEMDITAERIELIERVIKPTSSLDTGVTSEEIVWSLSEQMLDHRSQMLEEEALEPCEKEEISKNLECIDRRGAIVLRMYFGLGSGEPMTLRQVGKELNISGERVRQIKKEALRSLSDIMTSKVD